MDIINNLVNTNICQIESAAFGIQQRLHVPATHDEDEDTEAKQRVRTKNNSNLL